MTNNSKIIPGQTDGQNNKESTLLLFKLLALFWLIAKALSWKVWTKERMFPLVPAFDWLNWPSWVHLTLFISSVVLLILMLFKPLNKTIITCLFIIELISCLGDQNRWQPWEYQYIFTLFVCIINRTDYRKIITCIIIIMAGTYLYSGLGKLNEAYLVLAWDNLFFKYLFRVPEHLIRHEGFLHKCGYLTAVIEVTLAAGILFPKTKKIAAIFLIVMHLVILLAIGPWGRNYNLIVWPWNILMLIFLYIIFIQKGITTAKLKETWPGWNKLVMICWFFLPAFNYVGLWDNFLSSRLYSANLPLMAFCIKDSVESEKLKAYFVEGSRKAVCDGEAFVDLQTWAIREMHVPPYPEVRVYKKIEAEWRKRNKNSNTVILFYRILNNTEIETIPNDK